MDMIFTLPSKAKYCNYKFNIVRIKCIFSWLTQRIQKSVQFITSDGRSICTYNLWLAELLWLQAISRLSPARLVRTLSSHNLLERVKNTRWKGPLLKPLRTNYSVRGGTCDSGPALASHSASRKAARKCGESGFSDELLLTIHTIAVFARPPLPP